MVAHCRLGQSDRVDELANARLLTGGRRDQAEQSETGGISEDSKRGRDLVGVLKGEGCPKQGPAAVLVDFGDLH